MPDRRSDDRVQIGLNCVLYIDQTTEMNAVVKDISEIGVAFEIPFSDVVYEMMQNKRDITFAFLDDFMFFDASVSAVCQAKATIVRITKSEDVILIGCKLNPSKQIRSYVEKKKVNKFLAEIDAGKGS